MAHEGEHIMTPVRLDRQVTGRYGISAVFTDAGLTFTIGLGRLPASSPYSPGDWVRGHAYGPGHADPLVRDGFRGYVLGGLGNGILRGITDDGREWSAHFGHVGPDDDIAPAGPTACRCCPPRALTQRRRRDAARAARTGQHGLFDLVGTR
jgi:hypothetical protein